MEIITKELLYLLQLASPTLPVGAYTYSEGLETLIEAKVINNGEDLFHWLQQELTYGAIRLETAIMLRAYASFAINNLESLVFWNQWLSAAKETQELRQQSWQMGESLLRLLVDLQPELGYLKNDLKKGCNYAIAFGISAAYYQINTQATVMGYLHSWVTNLISAGIKLVPLGQTTGQKLLLSMQEVIIKESEEILVLKDEQLNTCGWGLAIASMNHEILYSRLFRS